MDKLCTYMLLSLSPVFGSVMCSCEIIRDWKTGDSLCYAFIEFEKVSFIFCSLARTGSSIFFFFLSVPQLDSKKTVKRPTLKWITCSSTIGAFMSISASLCQRSSGRGKVLLAACAQSVFVVVVF